MGQQQLLLLIVGVIMVGIAIAVGFQMFSTGAAITNRDAMVNDITHIAAHAQNHFLRPTAMGGGNGSFNGYKMPVSYALNANGEYSVQPSGGELIVTGNSVQYPDIVVKLTLSLSDEWLYIWDWEHDF